MDLDEDDYEALGYGAQKALERLAKDVGYVQAYRTLYMRQWRKDNPDKVKAIAKRRWQTIKADVIRKAKAAARVAKYRKTENGKASNRKRAKRHYEKYKDKINAKNREKYAAKKAARANKNTTDKRTKPSK